LKFEKKEVMAPLIEREQLQACPRLGCKLELKKRAKNSFLFRPLVFKGRAGNGSAFLISVERFRIRRFRVQGSRFRGSKKTYENRTI
jgi:hypothetical protein